MLHFPKEYFEDEVRDGYYVWNKMKRNWASQLEVLSDIDRVCKKLNITYFADWGTLLGTIRHQGFIPWDDDTDICMKRKDYQKFIKLAPAELRGRYHLINYQNNDDYWDVLTRVINSKEVSFDKDFLEKYHGFPYVTGVDIFPLDYLPRDKKQLDIQLRLIAGVKTVADSYNAGMLDEAALEMSLKEVEELTGIKINRKGDKTISEQLYDIVVGLYAMYNEDEADDLVQMGTYVDRFVEGGKMETYPKEWFDHALYLPFENIKMPVPTGYDALLKKKYGDYLTLIRDGGASTHDYPVYEKQDEFLERAGISDLKYKYSEEETIVEKKPGMRKQLKENVLNMVGLLSQACDELEKIMSMGQVQVALDLINQCQDGAIQVGNSIEEFQGKDTKTVKLLEELCELLFQVYEGLSQGADMDPAGVCALLKEQIGYIKAQADEEIHVKKEVVFIPYKAAMWDSLEGVWEEANNNPDVEAIVIPIPYYYKNPDGTFAEMVYEGDQYPDYVPIVHFNDYNFEQHHPDTVYIHNPYDEYNYVTSVHPFFYSKNLKQFTDELVYIPYFVLADFSASSPREVKSMEHFVLTPGVVQADKVIVQSENMKNNYVMALTDWAGEETREHWEKKIFGTGSPKLSKARKTKKENLDIPEEWRKKLVKPDGSFKKVILYNNSISALLESDDKMIDKMKRVFETFKEQQENITILWRPHPLIKGTLQSMRPELLKTYEELEKEYIAEDFGIYDDTADLHRAITMCDGYFGDPSSLVQLCREQEKPIMIQNVNV